MLKTQKVFWWRTSFANTEGKLGKEPDEEMGSVFSYSPINIKMVFYLEIFKEPFIADLGCSKIFIVDSSCTNCCRQLDTCMPETVSTIYFV